MGCTYNFMSLICGFVVNFGTSVVSTDGFFGGGSSNILSLSIWLSLFWWMQNWKVYADYKQSKLPFHVRSLCIVKRVVWIADVVQNRKPIDALAFIPFTWLCSKRLCSKLPSTFRREPTAYLGKQRPRDQENSWCELIQIGPTIWQVPGQIV